MTKLAGQWREVGAIICGCPKTISERKWPSSTTRGPGLCLAAELLGAAMVDLLAELTGDGAALEFAVGTARVAPAALHNGRACIGDRAFHCHGPPGCGLRMACKRIKVTIGDMATTRVEGGFRLVYLVFNSIGNLTNAGRTSGVLRQRRRGSLNSAATS